MIQLSLIHISVGGPAVRGQSDLRQSDRQTTTPVVLHPQGAYFPLGCRSQRCV